MVFGSQVDQKGETMVAEKAEHLVVGEVGSMGENMVVEKAASMAVSMDSRKVGWMVLTMAAWMVY